MDIVEFNRQYLDKVAEGVNTRRVRNYRQALASFVANVGLPNPKGVLPSPEPKAVVYYDSSSESYEIDLAANELVCKPLLEWQKAPNGRVTGLTWDEKEVTKFLSQS